jgi:CheY-like chemotaxis protein
MGRIMIVDDSRLARTVTSACLAKQGHQVQEVDPTSIFEVLQEIKAAVPDLLIMDFLMPNCPGTSLARACHEDPELQDMRMLVLTAHRDFEVTRRLHAMGVAEVLFKPFEPHILVEAVQRVMES